MKPSDRRARLLFAVVSLGFVAFGIVMLTGIRLNPWRYGGAPMAEYYTQMACRCPFYPNNATGEPWSIHTVGAPYRYRVLVPWLAGLLPLAPPTALSVITYVSLAVFYWLVLLSCRRLGSSAGASVFGLALAYVFEAHFVNYYHPFLVEGFGLMIIATMFYAFTIESFWLFAIAGLCGIFAREVTWFLLPVWCARSMKRGVALTVIAALALIVQRILLWGAPYQIDPVTIGLWHLHNPGNYLRDVRATWGWAFALTALGISLLPATSFRTVGPLAAGLLVAALCSSFLATDTPRLFGVLVPVVAVATARLIAVLAERRQRFLLASLCGMVVLQYCVTDQNGLTHDPAAIAAIVRPIRLGTAWVIVAAFILRRELAQSIREKLGAISYQPSAM